MVTPFYHQVAAPLVHSYTAQTTTRRQAALLSNTTGGVSLTPSYLQHQLASYQPGDPIVIGPDELQGIVQIPFGGSQPLGCTARPLGRSTDEVFVTTYFEPSVMRLICMRTHDGLTIKVDPIRSVKHDTKSVRIFPDIPGVPFGHENRGRGISVLPNGEVWVNRGDRKLFRLCEVYQDRVWFVVQEVVLPDMRNEERYVHSMDVTPTPNRELIIETVEGPAGAVDVICCHYRLDPYGSVTEEENLPLPATDFIYGWGAGKNGNHHWFVTDNRCTTAAHGIYCGNTLVLPDPGDASLTGTGIAFLGDGTAIITQYGQGFPGPFNGREGRLVIVPAHLLA